MQKNNFIHKVLIGFFTSFLFLMFLIIIIKFQNELFSKIEFNYFF